MGARQEIYYSKMYIRSTTRIITCIFTLASLITTMSGHQCTDNPPVRNSSSGLGQVKKLGGLKSYVSGSVDSKTAVILVSDVYGYEAPHLRQIADKVAAAGFYVVAPDFFRGDPFVAGNDKRPLSVWLKDHPPAQGYQDAKAVIEAVKEKGVCKIGAAGFCWGGKVVAKLGDRAKIKAAVLLHPAYVTVDDIKGDKVPMSVLAAELDQLTPVEVVKQFEAALKAKPEVDSFVKIFPGVKHGWTVRYMDEDEAAVKIAHEAQQDMLNWIVKHLK